MSNISDGNLTHRIGFTGVRKVKKPSKKTVRQPRNYQRLKNNKRPQRKGSVTTAR